MAETENRHLYIFLDEGGNLDFSPGGTRYFTLTSVCKTRPFNISQHLLRLKFDLIEFGLDFEFFHCAKNNRYVRERVFSIIESMIDEIQVDALIIEKAKAGPALREEKKFYPKMLGYLLRYIMERVPLAKIDEVLVITDTLPIQKKRSAVEKAIKVTLAAMRPAGCKYRIMHHASKSTIGLQVADYCNWAIWKKWEGGDDYFFRKIENAVRSEFDIFRSGRTLYY